MLFNKLLIFFFKTSVGVLFFIILITHKKTKRTACLVSYHVNIGEKKSQKIIFYFFVKIYTHLDCTIFILHQLHTAKATRVKIIVISLIFKSCVVLLISFGSIVIKH